VQHLQMPHSLSRQQKPGSVMLLTLLMQQLQQAQVLRLMPAAVCQVWK
jgi:hypothetical protein